MADKDLYDYYDFAQKENPVFTVHPSEFETISEAEIVKLTDEIQNVQIELNDQAFIYLDDLMNQLFNRKLYQ